MIEANLLQKEKLYGIAVRAPEFVKQAHYKIILNCSSHSQWGINEYLSDNKMKNIQLMRFKGHIVAQW